MIMADRCPARSGKQSWFNLSERERRAKTVMDGAGIATAAGGSERAKTRFVRDSTTWLAYLTMAYLLFIEASLGPIMPSLRAQMGMSYTVASLHFSAPAFGGMMMAGLASS